MKIINRILRKFGYVKLKHKDYPIALCSLRIWAGVNHVYHAEMLEKYNLFPIFAKRIVGKNELKSHTELLFTNKQDFLQYFDELQTKHIHSAEINGTNYNPYKNPFILIPAACE